jgi:D-tyrosyl-tRNA(Tyr) deacylase
MRVLLQRVSKASVTVDGQVTGAIDHGLVLLIGAGHADEKRHADRLAEKVVNLRIFNDEDGKFNRSLLDVEGGALVVSQFTLFADSRKGRRPGFTDAAPPEMAKPLCDYFADKIKQLGVQRVGCGVFGAHMDVEIHNDGPVTIWLDTDVIGV